MHYFTAIQQQKGFSLSGLLVISFFLIILALLGMKLVPVYLEYSSIQKNLTATAKEAGTQDSDFNQIKLAFAKRAQIDNIKSITVQDIKISKVNGRTVLSTQYSKQIPLVSNISLNIDFEATSE
jgi:acyl-CoA synthetase (AMP-forming)/AMP-acid ligase II